MQIRSLESKPLEYLVRVFLKAFADYAVKMPEDPEYWRKRLHGARFNAGISAGIFNGEELNAFIWNCLDHYRGHFCAYNTGTGVIPEHRGNAYIDQIYDHLFPKLDAMGVTRCVLEVIQDNERALKVYRRIGFREVRELHSYRGSLSQFDIPVITAKVSYENIPPGFKHDEEKYSWDNTAQAILAQASNYRSYYIKNNFGDPVGYFTINPAQSNLIQYYIEDGNYPLLFSGIQKLTETIKINNIEPVSKDLIQFLEQHEFTHVIDQYEMALDL
jgi:ribosomal protein S18 acetylase RimI-like enzyme